jgi:hypothetical protein
MSVNHIGLGMIATENPHAPPPMALKAEAIPVCRFAQECRHATDTANWNVGTRALVESVKGRGSAHDITNKS